MGALSSFVTGHGIAFGLCFDYPWIQRASSHKAYFLRMAGL